MIPCSSALLFIASEQDVSLKGPHKSLREEIRNVLKIKRTLGSFEEKVVWHKATLQVYACLRQNRNKR